MSDMSEAQRIAARKAFGKFPKCRPQIERDGSTTTITPHRGSQPGTPVVVTNGATPVSTIEKDLMNACHTLMET